MPLAGIYGRLRNEAACSKSDVLWIRLLCATTAERSSQASTSLAVKLSDRLRVAQEKAKKAREVVGTFEEDLHELYPANQYPMLTTPKLPEAMRSKPDQK